MAAGVWGTVSLVMQFPLSVTAVGVGATSAVGIAAAAKAKVEDLRERRRKDDEQ